jgi:hypothetical protein
VVSFTVIRMVQTGLIVRPFRLVISIFAVEGKEAPSGLNSGRLRETVWEPS